MKIGNLKQSPEHPPAIASRNFGQRLRRNWQRQRLGVVLLYGGCLYLLISQAGCASRSFEGPVAQVSDATQVFLKHRRSYPRLSNGELGFAEKAKLKSAASAIVKKVSIVHPSGQEQIDSIEDDSSDRLIEIVSFDDDLEEIPAQNARPEGSDELDFQINDRDDGWNLNQLIALCLSNDPSLGVGFQEIRQAFAEQVTASLKPNPELEILQSLLPLGRPFDAAAGREGGPPQFDVFISYPIDWYLFGKRAAAMRAAAQGRRAAGHEFADLIRERILEVALAYYDVLEQKGLLELAEQDVDNLREVERVTEVAVTNGALPRVELNRIKLDRLSSEQTMRETKRDLNAAKAALLALLGVTDQSADFPVAGDLETFLENFQLDEIPDLDQLYLSAQSSRPDIAGLRARVDEARSNIEVEFREQFAEVEPIFGYTRQFQERAIDFPDVSSWAVGLRMTLPINDRNQGNRVRANSELFQQLEELRLGLVELRSELIEVIAELETARENARSTGEEQLQLAEEVRDGIRKAYEAGGRPLIDVLDSQRNFRETFANFINSRADYLRAVQRFNAAMAQQNIE